MKRKPIGGDMKKFKTGTRIPVPGGKLIEEYIGNTTDIDEISVAHMKMPPGWTESAHATEYLEIVIVIQGQLTVINNQKETMISAGEVGYIPPTPLVLFCNKSDQICEYWAICTPAFSLHRTH
jgi:quercetin dioxygenase-like cupin family protein